MTAPDTGLNFGELYNKHGGEAEPLTEGSYDAVVSEAKAQSSKDGSKPQLVLQFKIVDHPKFSGRKLTTSLTVTTTSEMAMSIFFRQMAALGFDANFWAANPTNPLPTVAAQAVGRRARLQVKYEPWQGVERPKIKNIMPGSLSSGGGGLPPAPGMSGVPSAPPPPPQVPAAPAPAPAAYSQPVSTAPPQTVQVPAPAPAPAPQPVQEPAAAPEPVAEAPAPQPVGAGVGAPPAVPF